MFIEANKVIKEFMQTCHQYSPEDIQAAISHNNRIQLAVAYCIEGLSGTELDVRNHLAIQAQEATSLPVRANDASITAYVNHPQMSPLIQWQAASLPDFEHPSITMLSLINYLMKCPSRKFSHFLKDLENKHHLTHINQIDMNEVQKINSHPFFYLHHLHRASSPEFDDGYHNALYWANKLIYTMRMGKQAKKDIVRYSTYLDIINNAPKTMTVTSHDCTCKQLIDANTIGIILKHATKNFTTPFNLSSKNLNLYHINAKRFHFGQVYFDQATIDDVSHKLYFKPDEKSDDGLSMRLFKPDNSITTKIENDVNSPNQTNEAITLKKPS